MQSSGVHFGTSGARGLVSQMTDEVCYSYTQAFLQAISASTNTVGKVVLGHYLRPSSPRTTSDCVLEISQLSDEVA